MKKPDKKKYEEVPEVPTGEAVTRKKVSKPWNLEYMITDEGLMNSHSFFVNKAKVGEWNKDTWFSKMVSPKQALEQMNKIVRQTKGGRPDLPIHLHWRFAGKKFRLYNVDTQEVVSLLSNDTEFYAE